MSEEATPCHPFDEACGGPGGPCRNHGGVAVLNAAIRDLLKQRDEAVARVEELRHRHWMTRARQPHGKSTSYDYGFHDALAQALALIKEIP